jgi:hypothetical protein
MSRTFGTSGNNVFVGTRGANAYTGRGGADLYVLGQGGADTITDFNVADDKLELIGVKFASLADLLAHTTQLGANTVITLSPTNSITLQNVAMTALSEQNFSWLTPDELHINQTMTAHPHGDALASFANITAAGGAGRDSIYLWVDAQGGAGADSPTQGAKGFNSLGTIHDLVLDLGTLAAVNSGSPQESLTLHAQAEGGSGGGAQTSFAVTGAGGDATTDISNISITRTGDGYGGTFALIESWAQGGYGAYPDFSKYGDAIATIQNVKMIATGHVVNGVSSSNTLYLSDKASGATAQADIKRVSYIGTDDRETIIMTASSDGSNSSSINIMSNKFLLGGGNDEFQLNIITDTTRPLSQFTLNSSGNLFDGGDGQDIFTLRGTNLSNAIFDISHNIISVGGDSFIAKNFEIFYGTGSKLSGHNIHSRDTFLDGAGNQLYHMAGDDVRFSRGHGEDWVLDFASHPANGADVIDFHGFGRRFNSFAEVLAAATDFGGYLGIATPDGGHVYIDRHVSDLTADMFTFS